MQVQVITTVILLQSKCKLKCNRKVVAKIIKLLFCFGIICFVDIFLVILFFFFQLAKVYFSDISQEIETFSIA